MRSVLSGRHKPFSTATELATPEQREQALADTKTAIQKVLDISRELGLPDAEFGRVLDVYNAQLEIIVYHSEMTELHRRRELIGTLRARGAKAPGSDRSFRRQHPISIPSPLGLGEFMAVDPPSSDGLEEMSTDDLQALLDTREAIKPV